MSSLSNDLAGTGNDFGATFAYNPASQIASTVRTGDSYAWTGHFNENKSGVANGLNQLTSYGGVSLSHDARGNVTAFGAKSFTYSSENLLLTGPGGSSLSYDPLLRLQQLSGAATTKFAYDGLDRIAEYDGSNVVQRRYVHGAGTDEPIVWYEGGGTGDRRFLSSDERGSIISVTDGSGVLLGINRYDEFGQPQSGNLGVFGYTGQAWLPGVNLWHYKARVYEPELGRFLQTDPIGYEDSPNLYAYVRNDPVNLTDPLGLQSSQDPIFVTADRIDWAGNPAVAAGFQQLMARMSLAVGGALNERPIEIVGKKPQPTPEDPIIVTGTRAPTASQTPPPARTIFIFAGAGFDSGLPRDPAQLEKMLKEAKRKGDTKLVKRIQKQQKMLGVRNIQKQRGFPKLRFLPWILITPVENWLYLQNCKATEEGCIA